MKTSVLDLQMQLATLEAKIRGLNSRLDQESCPLVGMVLISMRYKVEAEKKEVERKLRKLI